jgi:hypothetical protein
MALARRFASFGDVGETDSDDEGEVVSSHTETIPVSGSGPFVYKVKVTVTGDCGCDPCEKCDASKIHRFKVKNHRLQSPEKLDTSLFSRPTFIKDAEKGWQRVTSFFEDLVSAGDDTTSASDGDDEQELIVIDDDSLDKIMEVPAPPAPMKKRESFWRRSKMNPELDRSFRSVVKKVEDAPILGTVAKAVEGALNPMVDVKSTSGLDPVEEEAFMEAVERELARNDKMKSLGRMKPSDKIKNSYMMPNFNKKPSYMDDEPYVVDYPAYTDKDVSMNHPHVDIPMMTAPLKFNNDNTLDDVDSLIDEIQEEMAKNSISYQPVASPIVAAAPRDLAAAAFAKAKAPYCRSCNHKCSVTVRTDVSVKKKKCCGC